MKADKHVLYMYLGFGSPKELSNFHEISGTELLFPRESSMFVEGVTRICENNLYSICLFKI